MKKIFYILTVIFMAVQLHSCSNDKDVQNVSELEKNFFSIENADYVGGKIPDATISETLEGIDMSNQVMNGAMNYITIITEQKVAKFFIGVKGIDGYWEYAPNATESRAIESYNSYLIPMMMSQSYTGDTTIILSGQLDNGDVTIPVENKVFYIETMPGAIEVKLAFSNCKDIDLHLYTPSGEHIYYDNKGGTFTDEFGDEISYGLDVDSNAGCEIDNKNKENIYIPAELVEEGTYTVVVDMYKNCQPSIPTSWSIVARYQGELISPTSGNNPASGVYLSGAADGDMTKVMTFNISESTNSRSDSRANIRNTWKFTPITLTKSDKNKLEFSMD